MFEEAERIARSIKLGSDREYSWSQTKALDVLASALANAQHFDEAERIARSIDGDMSRAEVLADVASILSRFGRHEAADRVFGDAVRTLSPAETPREGLITGMSFTEDYRYSTALAYVASKLAQSGRREEADRLFDETISVTVASYMKSVSIPFLMCKLAQSGRRKDLDRLVDEAEQSIRSNDDRESRVTGLTQLASALHIVQNFDEAERIIRSIESSSEQAEPLLALATAVAQNGEREAADKLFDEIGQKARSIEDKSRRFEALISLAAVLTQNGKSKAADKLIDEAVQIARSIEDNSQQNEALAATLLKAERFEDALHIIDKLSGQPLHTVLKILSDMNRPEAIKRYLIPCSYKLDAALQLCARMLHVYSDQAEEVFKEIKKYLKEPLST